MPDYNGEPQGTTKKPSALKVGELYDGKVLKIKPFGAIISLPDNAMGLVHISQIANGFIQSVNDVLAEGEEVLVRISAIDEATGKISLTMKDVPQPTEDEDGEEGYYYVDAPVVISPAQAASFEEKLKSWQKLSSDRIAGVNRRNKRKK